MKKPGFGIVFDPRMQPGFSTRYRSLDSLMQGGLIRGEGKETSPLPFTANEVFRESNLREKFNSGQIAQLLPSRMRRGEK